MNPRAKQNWAALTDVGRVRGHNEDSVLAQPPLFVVADGLGGHEAGEVASSIAVETLRDHAPRRAEAKALARAVRAANRAVLRAAKEGQGRPGMGTTMTAALVEGTTIALAHVGDSRAYLLHAGALSRLTEDHSMVADMIRRGQLTEAEARIHPHRSVITRALGTDNEMVADAYEVEVSAGDRLMLCSDGLTGMLEDVRIAHFLADNPDPADAARALIDAANEAGGVDNISVVIVDIEGDGASSRGTREEDRRLRGWLSVLGWIAVAALIVSAVVYGAIRYAERQAFLIAEDGVIVLYRGVPGEFAGVSLHWKVTTSNVEVADLSPGAQTRLSEGETFPSLDAAREAVDAYADQLPDETPPGSAPATTTPGSITTTPTGTP